MVRRRRGEWSRGRGLRGEGFGLEFLGGSAACEGAPLVVRCIGVPLASLYRVARYFSNSLSSLGRFVDGHAFLPRYGRRGVDGGFVRVIPRASSHASSTLVSDAFCGAFRFLFRDAFCFRGV